MNPFTTAWFPSLREGGIQVSVLFNYRHRARLIASPSGEGDHEVVVGFT